MVGENPFSQKKHGERIFFNESSPRRDTYTDSEYSKIVATARPGNQPIFILLGNLGLRASELAMLECSDIDEDKNTVSIRRKVIHDGVRYVPKDKTDRFIPMNAAVRNVLQTLGIKPGAAEYVVRLPAVKSRRDYFERTYLGKLKQLADATGIPASKLTLHNFRRFFVSQCADCGIPMATVMNWVGHDEMKMVMYYFRLRDESAQQAMNKFQISPPGKQYGAGDRRIASDDRHDHVSSPETRDNSDSGFGTGARGECDDVRADRTSSDAREHMGNGDGKTGFPVRKPG